MSSDISSIGWIVILSALALGFGLVRFLIVIARDKQDQEKKAKVDSPPNGL